MGKMANLAVASTSISNDRPYSKPLVLVALQIVFLSALFSFYDVQIPLGPALAWTKERVYQVPMVKSVLHALDRNLGPYIAWIRKYVGGRKVPHHQRTPNVQRPEKLSPPIAKSASNNDGASGNKARLPVFTSEQLALYDGSDPSRPVYLALLGRVFDVDKGRKHYGKGGGYHFFSGKDATRAFVTGDFSTDGLSADVSELADSELLSIQDWLIFYEREYRLLGVLSGTYFDRHGRPTELLEQVNVRMEAAKKGKEKQTKEQTIFPPCNSEWKKGVGGRVWCTNKSGGVARDWVGVPRRLYKPGSKEFRCVCVKNFGASLASSDSPDTGRGDLGHPALAEYEDCAPDANSCRILQHD